ncbi:PucR family transcriptional regulator ligand-binding domain-containing protein [Arthrobacter sp.]|uniref:helix-turn-helix domain-containing protein n=1 Tax=Arthrobacter sp. TaxID=1667 RepID=UPI003A8F23EC
MITLAEALASPPLAAADPHPVSDVPGALERTVRWVHSSEVLEIASLLRGGELLLTGGTELLKQNAAAQVDFMQRLGERGVCALCIEALPNSRRLAPTARAAAEAAGVPVFELHRVARFVDVTEEANRLIVDSQARLHVGIDRLSQLIAQDITEAGPDMTRIVHLIAGELDAEARLVSADGSVLADTAGSLTGPTLPAPGDTAGHDPAAVPPAGVSIDVVLDGQPTAELILTSTTTHRDHLAVAAERLRGILALALSQHHRPSLEQLAQNHLVSSVVEGREGRGVERLWQQNGLDPQGPAMVLVASGLERGADSLRLVRTLRVQEPRIMAQQREGKLVVVAPLLGDPLESRAHILHAAARAAAGSEVFGVAGPLVWSATAAHTSFAEAEAILRLHPPRPGSMRDALDLFGVRTLTAMEDHAVLATYSEALLGNVVRWDHRHGSSLAATLLAWFESGCNTTAAAQELHIERQSMHKRLAKIFELVGGDPRREGRVFALHLAARYLAS